MMANGKGEHFPTETKPRSIDLPILIRTPGIAQAQKVSKKACISQAAMYPDLLVACRTILTRVDTRSVAMAAVQITIEAHEQYISPKMVDTFKDQLTKGGEVSVKTRDDGRALKKRNLRNK